MIGMMDTGMKVMMVIIVVAAIGLVVATARWLKRR